MSEKPQLPFGWVVKQSKSYPDRVYYFNVNTGASTWEFPDLIRDYHVNPNAAGPISPPILSASLLTAGPSTPAVQGLQKQALEPSFSPQFSDDSPAENSPSRYGRKHYGTSKGHNFTAYQQKQDLRSFPAPQSALNPKVLSNHSNVPLHRNVADPRNILKQIPPVQTKSNPTELSFNNRPGLLGVSPHNNLGKFPQGQTGYNRPLHVDITQKTQALPVQSPSPITPQKCSNVQVFDTKAPGFKYNNESKIKISKTYNSKQDSLSLSSRGLPSSGLINNPYNKALEILNKSAEKSLAQLGKDRHDQNLKADKGNKVKATTSLSKPKCVQTSVSDRESLEKELNKSLEKDLKERQALEKALNKPLDINLKQREALARELNKSLDRDLNDNITKPGKRKVFDSENVDNNRKRMKHGKTEEKSKSPSKRLESRAVKRKSSEILKRDGELLDESEDRRNVIKGNQSGSNVSRNVVVKNTSVMFGANSTVSEDLKVQTSVNVSQNKALSSSRSFTRQVSEDSNISLELPEDPDQSGILRQFIGDKDKLLSIQSWINNIRDGAGSSIASADSFSESLSGDADDKRVVVSDKSTDCDSGYLSPPLKQPVKAERGWPGALKKTDITSREISAMEIDDVELPETDVRFEEEDMVIDLMLSEVREQMKTNPEKVYGTLTATVAELQEFIQEQCQAEKTRQTGDVHCKAQRQLYIVIDTNVVISDLPFVQDLKDQQISGYGKPILYIPWVVVQELDSLKQACTKGMPKLTASTQNKANKAIKMLQQLLRMKHPQLRGQTPMEAQEASRLFCGTCNDDMILMSCLYHKENNPEADIVLLTNDNNLINKALVCSVDAYNRKDLLEGLNKLQKKISIQSHKNIPGLSTTPEKDIPVIPTPSKQTGVPLPYTVIPCPSVSGTRTSVAQNLLQEEKCYTMEKLGDEILCSFKGLLRAGLGKVLETEMELAYSDMWQEIVLRKPPWSLTDILESIKKHWIAVFGMVLPRPLVENIDCLLQRLKDGKALSLEETSMCIRRALDFLEKCAKRNVYGSAFIEVVSKGHQLQSVCDGVCKGEINIQTISSLEDYLKKLPHSSQHQKICDNSLNLVQNNCRRGDNSSPKPASIMDDATSPAKSTGTLSTEESSWELAARKLQRIWQHIYTCCDEMRKLLNSGIGEDILKAVETTLSLLVPAAKEIRTEYAVVLKLPLSHLPGHMVKIGKLATQCNKFFSVLQLDDQDPPVNAENFLALFRNGQQRNSLDQFLSQLDEMLCHLYKCVQYLDAGN